MKHGKPYFELTMGGAAGGLLGALFGHLAVVGMHRLDPSASLYFKGPHGAPFFSLALNAGVYYAALAAGIFQGGRRLKGAALCFSVAFFLTVFPLAIATRFFSWGEGPSDPETLAWFYMVLGSYTLACALATAAVGYLWRAHLGAHALRSAGMAVAGAAAGYASAWLLNWLIPSLRPVYPVGILPPLSALADGAVSGAFIGAAIAFAVSTSDKKTPKAPSAAQRAA